MPIDPRRVQEIFLAALNGDTSMERAAVLDRECADDPDLRKRVDDLLKTHDLPDNLLDTPVLEGLSTRSPSHRSPGIEWQDSVAFGAGVVLAGRYRVMDLLGEGGMGSVYRAEQFEPFHRTVAVKVVKPGMDSKTVLARFASERQALALMDHPNIAKVLDAGTVDGQTSTINESLLELDQNLSRPFFVMELAEGEPISLFCVRHRLTVRQRIELFIPVCEAVQHAHQKGIIHRDLKPGNVLVVKRGSQFVPMVIDFGIAKSVGPRLGDESLETLPGLLVGSLDYMAPEQAIHGPASIDTRADVYSLGAMLYELLCGDVPHDRNRLRRASVLELARIFGEEESAAPSAKIKRNPDLVVAAGLGDPTRLANQLRGELDWVVTKCISKDPEQRYQTANALLEDLRRYLQNEPVLAGAPSSSYRVRKFVSRNRASVIAAGLTVLTLFAGIAGTIWGLVQSKHAEAAALVARDEKERARQNEELQRLEAQRQLSRADTEAGIARTVVQFLQNDLLRQADTQWQSQQRLEPEPNLTVRMALDRAAATIERRFGEQPAIEAAIRRTIGGAYDGLGEFAKAIVHLRQSVKLHEQLYGLDHDSTVEAKSDLGTALRHVGNYSEAIPLFESAYAWWQSRLGNDHRKTLNAANNLGVVYEKSGRHDDAYRVFSAVYENAQRRNLGPSIIFAALNNVACIDANQGRLDVAIKKIEELRTRWADELGSEVSVNLELLLNLGQFYLRAGRAADAIPVLSETLQLAQRRHSPEHPQLLTACFMLAQANMRSGRMVEAGRVLEECRSQCLDKVGPSHVRYHAATIELASWAAEAGQVERADRLISPTFEALDRRGSLAPMNRALAQLVMARINLLQGDPKEAEPLAREALAYLATRRTEEWLTPDARIMLGLTLAAQNRLADAEPILVEGFQAMKAILPQTSYAARRHLFEAIDALIKCADARNSGSDADKWRTEKQALRQQIGIE